MKKVYITNVYLPTYTKQRMMEQKEEIEKFNNNSWKLKYTAFSSGQNDQTEDQQRNKGLEQHYKSTTSNRHLQNISPIAAEYTFF